MGQTWKKVAVGGKELIEVTDQTVTTIDRQRIADEIRHLEDDQARADYEKAKAGERLALLRAQIAVLPEEIVEPEPAPEPVVPVGP